jgi:hypothetical protein
LFGLGLPLRVEVASKPVLGKPQRAPKPDAAEFIGVRIHPLAAHLETGRNLRGVEEATVRSLV